MPEALSTQLSAVPVRPRRGRPPGSVKDRRARVRDRIRTVATLNKLLVRVTCAENASQFARWFDEAMRKRHPLRGWDTEESGKWRKNFAGTVGLAAESIAHLEELFPDDRYYSASDTRRHAREIQVEYGLRRSPCKQSVSELFEVGPGRLWQALWGGEDALLDLWNHYSDEGLDGWGRDADFSDVVAELEMKLWSNSRCEVEIEEEDLGRAIMLYRLEQAGMAGRPEDGLTLYLCVRLAMAELSPTFRWLGVWDELATYVVSLESERVWTDPHYARLIEERYFNGQWSDELPSFVEDPFLLMWERSREDTWLADHYRLLSNLSTYRVKPVQLLD